MSLQLLYTYINSTLLMIIEQYNIQDGKAKSLTITLYTFQMGKGKEVLRTVTRVYNCNKGSR